MIPEIILFSIISIVTLLLRGKKINTVNFKIKGYHILIIAAAIELAAEFVYKNFGSDGLLKPLSFHWLIYLAILAVTLLNFNKTFMKFLFIGTLLNFIAIISNGFKMPVLITELISNAESKRIYLQTGQDLIHSLLNEETRFKILCDIIPLPPPYPYPKSLSIGDVFLLIGIFTAWQESSYKKIKISHPSDKI